MLATSIGSQLILCKTCNWPKIFFLLETNILAEAAASGDAYGLPRRFNLWMDKHYQILHILTVESWQCLSTVILAIGGFQSVKFS